MVTDGLTIFDIRILWLFSTKVFQFISDTHTPKNVMIVAEKKTKTETQKQEILK
jgi:hypothetical protein